MKTLKPILKTPVMPLLFFFMSFSFAYPAWLSDVEKAKAVATQSNKLILVSFTNDAATGETNKTNERIFKDGCFISYALHNLVLVKGDKTKNSSLINSLIQPTNTSTANVNSPKNYTFLITAKGKVLKQWNNIEALTAEEFVGQLIDNSYEFKQVKSYKFNSPTIPIK